MSMGKPTEAPAEALDAQDGIDDADAGNIDDIFGDDLGVDADVDAAPDPGAEAGTAPKAETEAEAESEGEPPAKDWAQSELDRVAAEVARAREEKAALEAERKQFSMQLQRMQEIERAIKDGDAKALRKLGFDEDRFFSSVLDDDDGDKPGAKKAQPGLPPEIEQQLRELREWKEAQEQERQRTQTTAQRQANIQYLQNAVSDDERWGLIRADGAHEQVLAEIERQHANGIQLPWDKAADIVEQRLENAVQRLAKMDSQKLKRLLGLAKEAQRQGQGSGLPKGVTRTAGAGVPHSEPDYSGLDPDEMIKIIDRDFNPFS